MIEFIDKYKWAAGGVVLVAVIMIVLWMLSKVVENKRTSWYKSFASDNGFKVKEDLLAPKVLFAKMVFFNQLKGIQFSNIITKKIGELQFMICESVFNTSHSRSIRHTRTNFIFVNEKFKCPDFALQYVGKMDKMNLSFYEKRGFQQCDFLPEEFWINSSNIEEIKQSYSSVLTSFIGKNQYYVEMNDYRLLVFHDTKRLETSTVSSYSEKFIEFAQQLG